MISGRIKIPGDKSISHRAGLFAALKESKSVFSNFNLNNDCAATLDCLSKMGIEHQLDKDQLTVWGKKTTDWKKPDSPLYSGNSGTTARLISGILAGLHFETELTGDASLSKRPMQRVIDPLTEMGAVIDSNNSYLPLKFKPVNELKAINYILPMSSAQVKSAVLLAGLNTQALTSVTENKVTRDHTERMLNLKNQSNGSQKQIFVSKNDWIPSLSMEIPGDFSSAAFFISAALLVPGSELTISNVSLNPTRTGYYGLLKQMGADIEYKMIREKPEPLGEMYIRYSDLDNVTVPETVIPNIIDEIPILAIVASQSKGRCVVKNARELRFKESDRITTIVSNLRALGLKLDEFDDGFAIEGPQSIKGGDVITHGDHRIAMAFTIAGLLAKGKVHIDDPACASVSFPEFYDILRSVKK
jgi:3-phosphoshikimate 1-carboxyvinyltransferase